MAYSIQTADVMDALRAMPADSFHGCLTDPPYHLTQASRGGSPRSNNPDTPHGRTKLASSGFMGKTWDGGDIAFRADTWREVLRVLKPGAFLLAFGGTRTYHRLTCAIEDAGFEIRDSICCWMYGNGFPKSLNISKAIDKAARGVPQGGPDPTSINHGNFKGGCSEDNPQGRGFGAGPGKFMRVKPGHEAFVNRTDAHSAGGRSQGWERPWRDDPEARKASHYIVEPETEAAKLWDGYGTALKPAWEPVIVAMKPLDGTFAANALKHGVAGLNIDGSRIGDFINDQPDGFDRYNAKLKEQGYRPNDYARGREGEASAERRYADKGSTNFAAKPGPRGGDPTGRWPANLILDQEAAEVLDEQSGELTSGANPTQRHVDKFRNTYQPYAGQECNPLRGAESGGASRFFYITKADSAERHASGQNNHPCVKPVDLTAYLARLILPPTGERRLLVPFCGSGSEMMGALRAGWNDVIGIEAEKEWVSLATRRIRDDAPLFNEEDLACRATSMP